MKLGDIRYFQVVVNSIDVTDAVIGCKIFQSMLEPTWTAQVYFQDSADLLTTAGITSCATVDITMQTKHDISTDMKKTFKFFVYRVGDKVMHNQKSVTYTLYCAPMELISNMVLKVSKSFKNVKMTDAIRDVIKDTFGPNIKVNGASCDNNATAVIPNWTPFNSIGWLMKMAYVNSAADYLFYQTDTNEYTLDTINNAFNKNASLEYLKVRPASINNSPTDVYNIIKYEFQHADTTTNLSTGYYGNTLKSFDFRTKKWTVNTNKPKDDAIKNATNAKTNAFNNVKDAMVSFKAKVKGVNGSNTSPYDDVEVWNQSRFGSLQSIEQNRLITQISGTVGVYQWLGKCINVDVPNVDGNSDKTTDAKLKGKFLVRSIVHNINRQTYTINLELSKRTLN